MHSIQVYETRRQIDDYLADRWKIIMQEAINHNGRFTAALSGGSTPLPFYEKLSQMPGLQWDKTFIFMVDERFVPPGDPDHNYTNIQNTLLKNVPIPSKNLHPIFTDLPSLQSSAWDYALQIKTFFTTEKFPAFDLVLLGMGHDGHTASLFPETSALHENDRPVTVCDPQNKLHERITLTYPVINNSKNIIALVTGKNKSVVLKEILVDGKDEYPMARINPANGELVFVLDKEAGSLLD